MYSNKSLNVLHNIIQYIEHNGVVFPDHLQSGHVVGQGLALPFKATDHVANGLVDNIDMAVQTSEP
jgi:hypothetical protein